MEAGCRCVDVEVFASRAPVALEVRCRHVASKRYVRLEAHCRRRDVGVFASLPQELGRCAVGVQTWRYGGSEVA